MQDIHTHLYWKSYDADRDVVVARARAAGVEEMLVIGCTVDESKQAIVIAEQYSHVYVAVGIHPHEWNLTSGTLHRETWMRELQELAKHEKVIAIGECGLDYYAHDKTKNISEEEKEVQRAGFLAQVALAEELMLPMILHCRPSVGTQDAYEDLFQILQNAKLVSHTTYFILHCYMGDTEVTQKFLTLPNVSFSFTANITYPVKKALIGTKDDLGETVKSVPLARLFTETDCPFLAPQSKRGERNEPSNVCEVAAKVAALHDVAVSAIEKATAENFQNIFRPHS